MNRTTPLALALTSLLAIACSEWGFTPFRRDPCRRDPAACLPDDPRNCDGVSTPASAITELVCPLRTSKWEAVLFWEVEVDPGIQMRVGGVLPPATPGGPSVVWLPQWRPVPGNDSNFQLFGFRGTDGAKQVLVEVEHHPHLGRPQIDSAGVTWFPISLEEDLNDGELPRYLGTWLHSIDGRRTKLPDRIEGAPPYYHTTPGDFDGDGKLDMWGNEYMFDHTGVLRFEARTQRRTGHWGDWPTLLSAIADVTGDGRREYLFSDGFLRPDGHYSCRSPHTHSSFAVVDIDGDGRPEVLALNNKLDPAPRTMTILDGHCRVLRSINLEDVLPPNAMLPSGFGPYLMAIAPMLQRDKPAFLIDMRRSSDDPERPRGSEAFALFDHDLNFVRLIDRAGTPSPRLVDLDGDGIYESLNIPVDGPHVVGRGLWVTDFRTGERAQLIDAANVGSGQMAYTFADIDGDGRGEIVLVAEDDDGRRFLRAYKGTGPGFAAARPFETASFRTDPQPYLHNPDGTPSQEPVRYDRLGLYNATPSGGWWAAVDADLRVRFTDVCTTDCPEGWLTYTVQVGNHGHGDVGADVLVRVYGERGDERTLLSEQRYRDVNSGQWNAAEPVSVRFQGDPFDRLRAVVEPDGWESQECDKTNNEAVWNLDCR